MRIIPLLILGSFLLLTACGHQQQGNQPEQPAADVQLITTGVALVPALQQMDSLHILFYNDPFGNDSTRYTRYYKEYRTANDTVIQALKTNLAKPFKEDSLRKCRSEGKIYCFANGRPVQTIYFTAQNESCRHLYFIHEARYYYFSPDAAFETLLRQLKPKAKEPQAGN